MTRSEPGSADAFAAGDLLVAASRVAQDDPNLRDLHGPGRVLQLSRDLTVRRELATGVDGLLVGVGLDPASGRLLCTDVRARCTTWLAADGSATPGPAVLPVRAFGSLVFAPDGHCFLGVHSKRQPTPADGLGEGKLARAHFGESRLELLDVEVDGGRFGFHCVTHLALAPDAPVVVYVSEGGRRVMRYDYAARRQLPDFLHLPPEDPRGTYGPALLADGTLLMATGNGFAWFREGGAELHRVECSPGRGWSRITLARDGASFFLSNFLEGIVQRRALPDGAVLAEVALGVRNCVSGLAEA